MSDEGGNEKKSRAKREAPTKKKPEAKAKVSKRPPATVEDDDGEDYEGEYENEDEGDGEIVVEGEGKGVVTFLGRMNPRGEALTTSTADKPKKKRKSRAYDLKDCSVTLRVSFSFKIFIICGKHSMNRSSYVPTTSQPP